MKKRIIIAAPTITAQTKHVCPPRPAPATRVDVFEPAAPLRTDKSARLDQFGPIVQICMYFGSSGTKRGLGLTSGVKIANILSHCYYNYAITGDSGDSDENQEQWYLIAFPALGDGRRVPDLPGRGPTLGNRASRTGPRGPRNG